MKKRLAVALTILLSGCGPSGAPMQPGQWEIVTSGQINGRQMPGQGPQTTTRCLRAQGPDPSRMMILSLLENQSCDIEGITVANGRIGGALQCSEFYSISASQPPVTGRYSATEFELTTSRPALGLTITANITGRRTGSC